MMRIAAVAALFAGAMGQEAPGKIEATCEFTATSQTVEGGGITSGTMYITYVPGVGATTDVMTTGMTPGLHGIHIHDFGDLSDTVAGTSTGPHYNPLDEIHGCYPTPPGEVPGEARKVGDMGNIIVAENGTGFYSERTNELIFLDGAISVIGRSAIVHALEDNCVREEGPGGDLSAGARIGYCVIGYAQQEQSAEVTAQREHIREQYHLLRAQYNITRAA